MKRLVGLLFLAIYLMGCYGVDYCAAINAIAQLCAFKDDRLVDLLIDKEEVEADTIDKPIDQTAFEEGKFVFLTFDDGPTRNTKKILDILAKYEVKGTFFVLGDAIQRNDASGPLLNRMVEEGHYIGLHSMSHEHYDLYKGDNAAQLFLDEMLELQQLIKEITGEFESELCRAPFGTATNFTKEHIDIVVDSSFNCWDWHIDSNDWEREVSAEQIMNNIKEGMWLAQGQNHLVVLFHEKDVTVEALPMAIEFFLDLGYDFLPYHPDYHFPVNLINEFGF